MKIETSTHLELILDKEERNTLSDMLLLLVLLQQKASDVKDWHLTELCGKASELISELYGYQNNFNNH